MEEIVYLFKGPGAGVPGLPHQVTMQEAERRGLKKLLEACIKKGLYEEKVKKLAEKEKSAKKKKE